MSSTQPTLQDFGAEQRAQRRRERRREIILAEGGVYGRQRSDEHDPTQPEGVCLHCGTPMPRAVRRVLGDNNGNVPCCADCRVGTGNEPYERHASAVRAYQNDLGKWQDGGDA
jgi:hypothetical protein